MTLPSHGSVLAVFHLAHALRLGSVDSLDVWEYQASRKASFVAGALNHRPIAEFLMSSAVVDCGEPSWTSRQLLPLSFRADRSTKLSIAILMLTLAPPSWLSVAVSDKEVIQEYIPGDDLKALSWLGDDLDRVLIEANGRVVAASPPLHLGLGRAAELLVLEGFLAEGLNPLHVADISDHFGYDVDCISRGFKKWEVKASTDSTASRFYLTRNEYETALANPRDWILVQVVFSSGVFASEYITNEHVASVRVLDVNSIRECTPSDSDRFRWLGEAILTPESERWRALALTLPKGLRLPSLEVLTSDSVERRVCLGGR